LEKMNRRGGGGLVGGTHALAAAAAGSARARVAGGAAGPAQLRVGRTRGEGETAWWAAERGWAGAREEWERRGMAWWARTTERPRRGKRGWLGRPGEKRDGPFPFLFLSLFFFLLPNLFTINELHIKWIHTKSKHHTRTNIYFRMMHQSLFL
jgi:hypothetical protein